jgi:adenylate kinase family enzyme
MQRVAIVGLPGAGKTTLALKLGALTGLEVLHADGMFWRPGGIRMSDAERQTKLRVVLDRASYIFEGAHGWTFGPRIAHCDTVIWMDIGLFQRLRNVIRRRRPTSDAVREGGNRQRSAVYFWPRFMLTQVEDGLDLTAALARRHESSRLIHLRSHAEAQAFLDSLPK